MADRTSVIVPGTPIGWLVGGPVLVHREDARVGKRRRGVLQREHGLPLIENMASYYATLCQCPHPILLWEGG